MKVSIVILYLAVTCHAQVQNPGFCPDIAAMQNLDLKRFEGVWYDQRHYETNLQPGNCTVTKYNVTSTNNANVLINMLIRSKENTTLPIQQVGKMSRGENVTDGSFYLTLRPIFTGSNDLLLRGFKGDYKILATNYTGFALIWSCISFTKSFIDNTTQHDQYVWILSRQQKPSAMDIQTINDVVSKFPHIVADSLVTADNKLCKNASGQTSVNFVIVFLFSTVLFFSR